MENGEAPSFLYSVFRSVCSFSPFFKRNNEQILFLYVSQWLEGIPQVLQINFMFNLKNKTK